MSLQCPKCFIVTGPPPIPGQVYYCPHCADRYRIPASNAPLATVRMLGIVLEEKSISEMGPVTTRETEQREKEIAAQKFAGAICARIEREVNEGIRNLNERRAGSGSTHRIIPRGEATGGELSKRLRIDEPGEAQRDRPDGRAEGAGEGDGTSVDTGRGEGRRKKRRSEG